MKTTLKEIETQMMFLQIHRLRLSRYETCLKGKGALPEFAGFVGLLKHNLLIIGKM